MSKKPTIGYGVCELLGCTILGMGTTWCKQGFRQEGVYASFRTLNL